MGDLPKDQDEFEAQLAEMLKQALPPSAEASLPDHVMYLMKQFEGAGFTSGQALYCTWCVLLQNPGYPPRP